MQGEIRVTVIATGFDRAQQAHAAQHAIEPPAPPVAAKGGPAVIPFNRAGRHTTSGTSRPAAGADSLPRRPATPPVPPPERALPPQDLTDMEIPTFIRRQMD
jgi:hypothetical protein